MLRRTSNVLRHLERRGTSCTALPSARQRALPAARRSITSVPASSSSHSCTRSVRRAHAGNLQQRSFGPSITQRPLVTHRQSRIVIPLTRQSFHSVVRPFSLPSHEVLEMPALSPSMETGNLARWLVKEGDEIKAGDVLAEVETDKATVAWESVEAGYVAKILIKEGTQGVAVGQDACVIVDSADDVAAFKDFTGSDSSGSGSGNATESKPEESPPEKSESKPAPAEAKKSPAKDTASLPDHELLEMPALSPTMATGNLARWLKQEGDEIKAGDVLAEVETDKATVAWESVESGFMAKILIQEGTEGVAVGAAACIVVDDKSDVSAFKNYKHDGSASSSKEEASSESSAESSKESSKESAPAKSEAPAHTGGRVFASPKARRIAREKGVDISKVKPTGPRGRILVADVESYTPSEPKASAAKPNEERRADAAPTPKPQAAASTKASDLPTRANATAQDYKDVPHSMVRRTIAKRLAKSKQTVPHYQVSVDVSIDKLMEVRKVLNAQLDANEKISVNDFIVKASALALKEVPGVNSSWSDDAIRMYNYVDISVAVATDGGLITPIVVDADKKGLKTIASNTKDLAKRARDGKLAPQEYQGGTFTISNLGMFGVTSFNAIINEPQSAILAVGGPQKRLIPRDVAPDSSEAPFTISTIITVTMSADHRTVDGAMNAQWLQAFKKYIEDPMKMLL